MFFTHLKNFGFGKYSNRQIFENDTCEVEYYNYNLGKIVYNQFFELNNSEFKIVAEEFITNNYLLKNNFNETNIKRLKEIVNKLIGYPIILTNKIDLPKISYGVHMFFLLALDELKYVHLEIAYD